MLVTREDGDWCLQNSSEGLSPSDDYGQHSSRLQIRGADTFANEEHADLKYRGRVLDLDDGRWESQKAHRMAHGQGQPFLVGFSAIFFQPE